ncbi:hypothetical protein [Streptomyces sp. NRRL S-1448]|uniref:hypothetical protein n=1 Tax=Streptomyces sp. NRRL S-1448 TaxID=1463883 RepID=UPI00068D3B4A|nr:hypothetical protein [Streptomyces sp. NRRL S-1448]
MAGWPVTLDRAGIMDPSFRRDYTEQRRPVARFARAAWDEQVRTALAGGPTANRCCARYGTPSPGIHNWSHMYGSS